MTPERQPFPHRIIQRTNTHQEGTVMATVHRLNPPVLDLSELHPGDRIEARRNGFTHYFGQVGHTVPGYGIVWIIEGVGGMRKLLYREDYDLHRSTR
jgi:hypothetical protein